MLKPTLSGRFTGASGNSRNTGEPDQIAVSKSRIFPPASHSPGDDSLISLGESMQIPAGKLAADSEIPAGYLFLTQFIENDISGADESSAAPVFYQRGLDLKSVYGSPPARDEFRDLDNPHKLQIGQTLGTGEFGIHQALPNDLPRVAGGGQQGQALIGDIRNDQNLGLAQTQLLFLKLHNRFVDLGMSFDEARAANIQHYQSMLINDYLRRLVSPNVFNHVFKRPDYQSLFVESSYLPLEFSLSAFRFAYSMFCINYDWNSIYSSLGEAGQAHITQLFRHSGHVVKANRRLRLPSHWIIDWGRFYELADGSQSVNRTKPINASHIGELNRLIEMPMSSGSAPSNLASRILLCEKQFRIPSGEAIIGMLRGRGLNLKPLDQQQLQISAAELQGHCPLWYYLLREAQVHHQGSRLGELGSWLVADTLKRSILNSDYSVLKDTRFTPHPQLLNGSQTTSMSAIVKFVDDTNPLQHL